MLYHWQTIITKSYILANTIRYVSHYHLNYLKSIFHKFCISSWLQYFPRLYTVIHSGFPLKRLFNSNRDLGSNQVQVRTLKPDFQCSLEDYGNKIFSHLPLPPLCALSQTKLSKCLHIQTHQINASFVLKRRDILNTSIFFL